MPRVYKLVTLSMVMAPYQDVVFFKHVREILAKKYGELAEHVDRAFDRWYIGGKYVPVIHGATIYGAIKRALNVVGKPMTGVSVHYAMFNEEDIHVFKQSIVNAKGKQTLVVTEAIRAGAEGTLVGNLEKLKKQGIEELVIQVGGKRKHGYGLIKLEL